MPRQSQAWWCIAWCQTLTWGLGSLHSQIEQVRLKCKNIFIGRHFVTSSNVHLYRVGHKPLLKVMITQFINVYKHLSAKKILTHLSHIYASWNWVSIGSGNGLSPVRRQAINWTNGCLLPIGHLETNFIEILIKIQNFSFMKMPSLKWPPFCPGGDELRLLFVLASTIHIHTVCRLHIYECMLDSWESKISFNVTEKHLSELSSCAVPCRAYTNQV